ncbi:Ger(x)C family spore germination protein [Sporosarcina sp. FSL W7-1349]|uniref:Ger(x)C family spore germination protein n=1 Tax=Sporosarcina sp. FSL W7-1349 TaxID=2921561 RepID=UPI0030F83B2D
MKNKILCAVGLLLLAFLSGCWSNNEPERMLYVHGLGVDFEDGEYKVYVQIINFRNVAKSEQPTSESNQAEVGFAAGKTVSEAIIKLYHSADEKVYWGHLTFIVLSKNVLDNGRLNSVIDGFVRYRDTRYRVWLYSTEDPVKDILLTIPIINTAITLSTLGDPSNSYEQESFIEPVNMRRMIIQMDEPSYEAVIPYITITRNWETVEGKDPIAKLQGVGVVTPKEFKGFISGEKADGLQWMNKETKRGEVTIHLDGGEEDYITVILEKLKVDIRPVTEGDTVKFDIDVKMTGGIGLLHRSTNYDTVKKKTEEKIADDIKKTYREALDRDIDIYRLSEVLYRKNNKEWKRLQQNGKVELSEDSIRSLNVQVNVKSGRKQLKETIQ